MVDIEITLIPEVTQRQAAGLETLVGDVIVARCAEEYHHFIGLFDQCLAVKLQAVAVQFMFNLQHSGGVAHSYSALVISTVVSKEAMEVSLRYALADTGYQLRCQPLEKLRVGRQIRGVRFG